MEPLHFGQEDEDDSRRTGFFKVAWKSTLHPTSLFWGLIVSRPGQLVFRQLGYELVVTQRIKHLVLERKRLPCIPEGKLLSDSHE